MVNQDEHFDPQDALIPKVHVYDSGPFEVAFGPAGGMETANIGDFVLIKFFGEFSLQAYYCNFKPRSPSVYYYVIHSD